MNRIGKPTWTAAEDAELRRLRGEGVPFSAIGRRMGKTKNACLARADRLGILNKQPARYRPQLFPPKGCCRFSLSASSPHVFCGQPGDPWCAHHRAIVFVTAPWKDAGT